MKAQALYEKGALHLLKQGKRSVVAGHCRYRQDATASCPLRCAIGAVIPDDKYDPKMETMGSVHGLLRRGDPMVFEFLRPHLELTSDLQDVHDDHPPSEWAGILLDLGYAYDLDVRPIERFLRAEA